MKLEERKDNKQILRIFFLLAIILVTALFLVGIIQTFIYNGLNEKLNNLQAENNSISEEIIKAEEEYEIRESGENIENFEEGDKKIVFEE